MKVGDVLARYKPAERLVRVLLDGSIQSEIDDVRLRKRQIGKVEKANDPGLRSRLPALEEELAKLEQRADEASVTFKVAAIPGKDFDRLKYQHPPTEKDWNRYRDTAESNATLNLLGRLRAPEYNFDTFMPRLIGLSVREIDGEAVDWTEEDGVELWDGLHDGARFTIANAVVEVNDDQSSRPLSETATGATMNSGNGSTTSATEESPTPPTSDG